MPIVLRSKLCKILLHTARIRYENTYDMRGILSNFLPPCLQPKHVNFSDLVVQKYDLVKMAIICA